VYIPRPTPRTATIGRMRTIVPTYADDWLTYPNLPRVKEMLNCNNGGWRGIVNHHMWWMTHIPHNPGVTDGFYNNWWEYIVNYDEAIKKLPPPGRHSRRPRPRCTRSRGRDRGIVVGDVKRKAIVLLSGGLDSATVLLSPRPRATMFTRSRSDTDASRCRDRGGAASRREYRRVQASDPRYRSARDRRLRAYERYRVPRGDRSRRWPRGSP